jgi:hypothetical protein
MASEYDFMTPEDRAKKAAELANKRQAWASIRSRGKARFVLLRGAWREAVFVILWNVFYASYLHVNIALAVRVTLLILPMGRVFNLLEWHWNERHYFLKPDQQSEIRPAEPR